MKIVYIVELENKFPEYELDYKVVVIAGSKDEAESKIKKHYPDLKIEAIERIVPKNVLL